MISAAQAREKANEIIKNRNEKFKANCLSYVRDIIMPKIQMAMNSGDFSTLVFINHENMETEIITILESYGYKAGRKSASDYLKISWNEE